MECLGINSLKLFFQLDVNYRIYTPLKLTAKAPENRQRAYFKEIHLNQPSIFRNKIAVSFREGITCTLSICFSALNQSHDFQQCSAGSFLSTNNIENEALMGLNLGRLTWNPKMEVWKMIFLINLVIFRLPC